MTLTPEIKRTCVSLPECPAAPRAQRPTLSHMNFPTLPFQFNDEEERSWGSSEPSSETTPKPRPVYTNLSASFDGAKLGKRQRSVLSMSETVALFKEANELKQHAALFECLQGHRFPKAA